MYVCMCVCVYIHVYIYIYIERERDIVNDDNDSYNNGMILDGALRASPRTAGGRGEAAVHSYIVLCYSIVYYIITVCYYYVILFTITSLVYE